jgi:activator of HSP90 ATPase
MAAVLGSLATKPDALAQSQTPPATQEQKEATQRRSAIHQEIDLKASSERIYKTLLDSEQFAAFTGMPATIDPAKGGTLSMFGGLIVGVIVELIPNLRIVQAWRPTHWDPGVYSMVKFELRPHDSETMVVLDHTGFPEGEFEHLDTGWPLRYWNPLKKFLAKG